MKTYHSRSKRRLEAKLFVSSEYGLTYAIERVLREHSDAIAEFKRGDASAVAVISGDVHRVLEMNGFSGPFAVVRDRVQSLMTRRYLMN